MIVVWRNHKIRALAVMSIASVGVCLGGCTLTARLPAGRVGQNGSPSRPSPSVAGDFLRDDFRSLSERFGDVPKLWALQSFVMNVPPQIWERLEYRRLHASLWSATIQQGRVRIAMPPHWHAVSQKPLDRYRTSYWVESLPREDSFRMVVAIPSCVRKKRAKERTGSGAAARTVHRTNGRSNSEPDLLRAERWANTTPMDLFPLLGSQKGHLKEWQLKRYKMFSGL